METKELLEVLFLVFKGAILPPIIMWLGYHVNEFVQVNIDTKKQARITDIVKASVLYVEQVFGVNVGVQGKDKLELAVQEVQRKLALKGIVLSDADIEFYIESFVGELNWNMHKGDE